jgi:uncharacterized damage-inducible protein DinB
MRMAALVALSLVAASTSLRAQHQHAPGHAGGLAAVVPFWTRVKDLYRRSAEQMPEDKFAFQPTDQVRTFGQILGHIANEHYIFCSAALGEKDPNTANFEKTTAKAAMIKALEDSFAYCDQAYRMSEMRAMEETTFFDSKGSRLWVLNYNLMHDSEHYGNLVTYFRLNGMVPPSSQGG